MVLIHGSDEINQQIRLGIRRPDLCFEEVSRKGECQPCYRVAVAVREGEPGDFYPVCVYHTRKDGVVSLAALIRALGEAGCT